MDDFNQSVARRWTIEGDAPSRVVLAKSDVTDALYSGQCPINVGKPYTPRERPPRRFMHSMEADHLERIFSHANRTPRSFLEIGSFWGDTSILIAKTFNIPGVCVDTWLGDLAVWNAPAPSGFLYQGLGLQQNAKGSLVSRIARRVFRQAVQVPREIPPASRFFRQFASNVVAAQAEHLLTPVRLPSPSALRLLRQHGLQFDAIYVDGSHDYIDVRIDAALAYQLLAPGGIIFGDDVQFDDVRDAVTEFCAEEGADMTILDIDDKRRKYWLATRTA